MNRKGKNHNNVIQDLKISKEVYTLWNEQTMFNQTIYCTQMVLAQHHLGGKAKNLNFASISIFTIYTFIYKQNILLISKVIQPLLTFNNSASHFEEQAHNIEWGNSHTRKYLQVIKIHLFLGHIIYIIWFILQAIMR